MNLLELTKRDTKEILKTFSVAFDEKSTTRLDSMKRFQELGLPTKKSEIFSKTGVKSIYENDYLKDKQSESHMDLSNSDNYRIVFRKGFYSPLQSKLPDGVSINFDKEPTLNKKSTNPFYFLSGALNQNFYSIKVQKDLHVEVPLEIVYIDDLYKAQTHMYITLELDENSKLNLFEKVLIGNETLFNHTLNVLLENNSEIIHVRENNAQESTQTISTYNYTQNKNSKAKVYAYENGSDFNITYWDIDLAGQNADMNFTALQLPTKKQRLNTIVNLIHNAANTTSTQLIKQVIDDEAKGLVDAKVVVSKDGEGTKANQLCNSLILSDEASVQAYVKPQLEIFIDDLEASHGATVGSLSEEHLYYLMSRGIKENDARDMLIEAFKKEAYESFPAWAKEDMYENQYDQK